MEYTIHLFHAGGVVMYPLVLFMLAACTILFERIRIEELIVSYNNYLTILMLVAIVITGLLLKVL